MKYCFLIIFLLSSFCRSAAQDRVLDRYIYTDMVFDAESIPNIGYEHFFMPDARLKSWRIDVAYQAHYSNQFGIVTSHGDRISAGVYQGPAAKFGYTLYNLKRHKNWHNYFTFGLGLKYLWYDSIQVNTGRRTTTDAYRIQSEKCVDAVPQFALGSKHTRNNFCADFFIGLQFPVKDRFKTIYWDQENATTVNPYVPYKTSQFMIEPALLVGIDLGFVKLKNKAHPASQPGAPGQ